MERAQPSISEEPEGGISAEQRNLSTQRHKPDESCVEGVVRSSLPVWDERDNGINTSLTELDVRFKVSMYFQKPSLEFNRQQIHLKTSPF